jgi:hypothetical protein
VSFLVLANALSELSLVIETGKGQAVTSPANTVEASKPSRYAWQGTLWPPVTDVQVHCCAEETSFFFCMVPFRCIHEAAGDFYVCFFVYNMVLWNQFLVVTSINIALMLHVFLICWSRQSHDTHFLKPEMEKLNVCFQSKQLHRVWTKLHA